MAKQDNPMQACRAQATTREEGPCARYSPDRIRPTTKASPGRFDLARGKAFGAVMLGMGGFAQRKRAEEQAYFMAAMNGLFDGKVVPVPGGVLVRDAKGAVLGALGITGDSSENDAAAAVAGVEAAGFTAEP